MFSFFNKFMLRSLVIKSLFVLVLPLSTEFAMKENIYEEKEDLLLGECEILQTSYTQEERIISSNENIETSKGRGKDIVEDVKLRGRNKKENEFKDISVKKSELRENKKKKQGYNQSLSSIFCGVYNEKRPDPIFDYRCATFLFFCPLVFNSLLNFIFEIDNKPSGMFLNFFSVGWRTPLLLNFITFDIHFNWFLFAISTYFDFVYFPKEYCHCYFNKLLDKNIIPLFLFSFVFDAVSLCVNFKVDDYFYITVNLSSILRTIVSGLFVISKKEEKTRMKSSHASNTQFSVPEYDVHNASRKNYKVDNSKVNNGNININGSNNCSSLFNKNNNINESINIVKPIKNSEITFEIKDNEEEKKKGENHEEYSPRSQSEDSEEINNEDINNNINNNKDENMPSNLKKYTDCDNNMFSNMTFGDGLSYNKEMQRKVNKTLDDSVVSLLKEEDDKKKEENFFDICQPNLAQLEILGKNVNINNITKENISAIPDNVDVNNSLMDNMENEKKNEDTVVHTVNNNAATNTMKVKNSLNNTEIKEEDVNVIEEKKNENQFKIDENIDENFKPK